MTEIQADPRRCMRVLPVGDPSPNVHCDGLMDAIEQTEARAFTVYKCRKCGRETVVDSFNLEVKRVALSAG